MSRVLIIGEGEFKENMAGPTIRGWELARCLSQNHKVGLLLKNARNINVPFDIINEDLTDIKKIINHYDVIIGYPFLLKDYPFLKREEVPLVIDLYNLYPIENLSILSNKDKYSALSENNFLLEIYKELLKRGDFFICSNHRQRDFWLGMLMVLGRISPPLYAQDERLKQLIDLVPFGIPKELPVHNQCVIRKKGENVTTDDKIILWGAIYDWLDPITTIKALEKIVKNRPEVKLYFMGLNHPISSTPHMKLSDIAISYTKGKGLYNKNIFFNNWIPYFNRHNYLLEADIGISTYPLTCETHFSHRTRILDYIWARLPMVVSEGDSLSEFIKEKGLGIVVKSEDVDGLVLGIECLLYDGQLHQRCKNNLDKVAPLFYWENLIKPLEDFCLNPRISETKMEIKDNLNHKSLFYHIEHIPFYVDRYGFRGVMSRIETRIRKKIKFLISVFKVSLAILMNYLTFIFSFSMVFLNDIFIYPFFRRTKTKMINKKEYYRGVSLLVLNFNGKNFLKECLDSLLKQSFQEYELIVVDNGSVDGSVEFIREHYPEVKLIVNKENLGFSTAANIGIKEAKGELIALFNTDIVVHPDWLENMRNALISNEDVGFCASKILFYRNPNTINAAGDCFTIYGEAINIGFGERDNGAYDEERYVFSACAAATIYRRTMLEEVGLFDEDYFLVYEDMDLGFRAQLKGWKCLYVPSAVIYHHWNAIIIHYSYKHIFYMSKNNMNLITKNMPMILLVKYFFPILARHTFLSFKLALDGSCRAYLNGKLRYLTQLPIMLNKRNEILKNRKTSYKQLDDLLKK